MKLFKQYQGLSTQVYVICLCKIIDKLGGLIGPMFTLLLSSKLNFSASKIAEWMLINSLITLPLGLYSGRLADKMSKKLLINICDISSSIIYIICGILPLSEFTIIFYLFGSLLQTAERAAYNVLLADNAPSKDRERAYSLGYLSTNLGMIMAPILGGFLLKDHCSLLFLISGISQLFSLILFDIYVKDSKLSVDEDNKYEAISDKKNVLAILKQNPTVVLFEICLCFSFVFYHQFNYLLPLQFNNVHADNGSIYYGLVSSVNCITVVLCTATVTGLISRFYSIEKVVISIIFELMGYLLFGFFIKLPLVCYVASFVFTIGEIIQTITTSPYFFNRIPANYRGRCDALFDTTNEIIVSLSSIVIGKIYDLKGFSLTWSMIIILGLILTICYALLLKPDKRDYPDLYTKRNVL